MKELHILYNISQKTEELCSSESKIINNEFCTMCKIHSLTFAFGKIFSLSSSSQSDSTALVHQMS